MINLNNVSNVVNNVHSNIQSNNRVIEKSSEAVSHNESSTVVNLQSNLNRMTDKNNVVVNSSNAKNIVADIASLLSKSDGKVQSNISPFDAASLLS
ncbi:MAG: hypothetical protein SPK83_07330 [Succinivibrio dextrinosolvens]|uniref:hypothetical protein n=1 Tax=Succinivibrio sp. TaxID=2053619 RepID=UPI0025EAF01A|nr:hypothetical protein [Succinivibrio sp.]MBQ9221452.1 hypothetical protein [Succinivibrio sp.]MDY6416647.1 hypothetical protein [Succinivibrio dextrinosolvens]